MGRLLKLVLVLLVLGGIALVGFAYFGDLTPPTAPVSLPVDLGGDD